MVSALQPNIGPAQHTTATFLKSYKCMGKFPLHRIRHLLDIPGETRDTRLVVARGEPKVASLTQHQVPKPHGDIWLAQTTTPVF
jgi:hypothetical protein